MEDSDEEMSERPMSLYRQMQRASRLQNLERSPRAHRGERWREVVDHDELVGELFCPLLQLPVVNDIFSCSGRS